MENKQTAVEWLVNQIWKYEPLEHEQKVIEQAKQMEKQQMKDVYMEHVLRPFVFNFEEYYKETYGK